MFSGELCLYVEVFALERNVEKLPQAKTISMGNLKKNEKD